MYHLKSCRKCGGKAVIKRSYDTLQIVCKSCGNSGKKYFGDYYDEGFMLETYGSSAVKDWNDR